MPFSQIIPPSPSPTESKRLFYRMFFSLLWKSLSSVWNGLSFRVQLWVMLQATG